MGEIKDKNVYIGELKNYQRKRIKEWLNDGNKFEIKFTGDLKDKSDALKKLKKEIEKEFPKANGIVKIFIDSGNGPGKSALGIPVILKE